jgi:hypothetical protein
VLELVEARQHLHRRKMRELGFGVDRERGGLAGAEVARGNRGDARRAETVIGIEALAGVVDREYGRRMREQLGDFLAR